MARREEVRAVGPEATHLPVSVARPGEVDRSPGVTQRASEIAQDQLARETAEALGRRRPAAADQITRDKIRRERERRRREFERRALSAKGADPADGDDRSAFDVVA